MFLNKYSKWLAPVVFLFFAAALGAGAATTIGTDIVTEGTLTVGGHALLADELLDIYKDDGGAFVRFTGEAGGIIADADIEIREDGGDGCIEISGVLYCGSHNSATPPYECSGASPGHFHAQDLNIFCYCDPDDGSWKRSEAGGFCVDD